MTGRWVGHVSGLGAAVLVASLLFTGTSGLRASGASRARADASGVTWVCRPGMANDPCLAPEDAISVSASGARTVLRASAATHSGFDCFYVYPTVTASAATSNSGLAVSSAEVATAIAQASRFSQVCRVFAPTYRQRTAASLAKGLGNDPTADLVSYDSVLKDWKDYLAHDNHRRPIIFLGHSQGAANLIRLLRSQVDDNPTLRRRMVVAIILGGNVQIPDGKSVGGTFTHLPACRSTRETGCVIAYSSFSSPPPADSLFGRPGTGVSLQSGQRQSRGQQVLCTNPADLGSGGPAALSAFFPSAARAAPWVTYPGLYTGTCENEGGASWLQVTAAPGDRRPVVTPSLGATWGLHADDVNLALGNLIDDVRAEEASYSAHHSP